MASKHMKHTRGIVSHILPVVTSYEEGLYDLMEDRSCWMNKEEEDHLPKVWWYLGRNLCVARALHTAMLSGHARVSLRCSLNSHAEFPFEGILSSFLDSVYKP